MFSFLLNVIRIDVVLELISFAICIFISLSFLRAHLRLGSSTFVLLSAGFGLMGGAMLVRAITIGAALFSFFGSLFYVTEKGLRSVEEFRRFMRLARAFGLEI
ncbi:MAG: hypothetical protein ACO2O1_07425 [Candidatus Caldarchaeales archaeon]|jgi:hypothetical protein